MNRQTLSACFGAAALLLASNAPARSRVSANAAPASGPTELVVLGSSDAPFEYQNWYSNGVVEYALAAPEWMSPVRGEFDRPARILASLFLEQNASFLGITQDSTAFKHESTTLACDGSSHVSFEQTYASLPIESTRLDVEVRGQLVTKVVARFIPEVSKLPVCQPAVNGNQTMTELYYRPETDRTIVIVVVLEDVAGPRLERLLDACTGSELGYKLLLQ